MGSGKKRAAVLGFLGITMAEEDQVGGWLQGRQSQQYHCHAHDYATGTSVATSKVRPSDDDGCVDGRPWWYAERDIDRRASEFIDRVHRGMLAGDGPSSSTR